MGNIVSWITRRKIKMYDTNILCKKIINYYLLHNLGSNDFDSFCVEYCIGSNMELGYYSPSKSDLFARGVKRGKLVRNAKKPITGFMYFFDNNHELIHAKRLINGVPSELFYFERAGNYKYGYVFDYISDATQKTKILPDRILCIEYCEGNIINYCCTVIDIDLISMPEIKIVRTLSEYEEFAYADGELKAIKYINIINDLINNEKQVLTEERFDFFNGKHWIKSN